MTEPLRVRATRRAARLSFPLWRRLGVHVTAVHFYEPVPDARELPASTWEPSELAGLEMNESAQLELLDDFVGRFSDGWRQLPRQQTGDPFRFTLDNPSFGAVDAEILYAMVRSLQPRQVIEVGSGYTTLLMAEAIRADRTADGGSAKFIAIDPYPNATVSSKPVGLTGLIESRVQDVPLAQFQRLGDGDILFIDSSHVLGIGTDVQYLFLEVIPRLAAGVTVHVHDIFLPTEYPRQWVMDEHRFWTEQYLLQAFLAFNESWDVVWAGSYMQERHPQRIAEAIPSYRRGVRPGSFWMRRRNPSSKRSKA